MEKDMLEKILKERINNSNEFNGNEQEIILDNISLYTKIYLLGIIDSRM